MKKTLLIAGALLLATASSAFAQGYNPYYGGRADYGRQNAYTDYFRQLRACQRHERLHEELDAAHADEHGEGLQSRGDTAICMMHSRMRMTPIMTITRVPTSATA